MNRPPVIGLTGGIGSGKSAVADHFAELGIPIIDTDAISHQLTGPGGAAMPAIMAAFGSAMKKPDGALDRDAMRRRVFADPAARVQLEAILHPLIRAESQDQLVAAGTPAGGKPYPPYLVLVVPLLVESGAHRERADRLLVVDCPVETQIERVMNRSGMSRDEVMRIVTTQASREQRLAAADDLIENSGTLSHLYRQVDALDAAYRANRGRFLLRD